MAETGKPRPSGLGVVTTAAQILDATFYNAEHYNMGKAGYGYGWRCEQLPRVHMIDRTFRPCKEHPDGATIREWYVDGERVASVQAAAEAMSKPPVFTEEEQRMLNCVPAEFTCLRRVEDDLAGAHRPSGGGIMPNTPHSYVLGILHALNNKGAIEYGRQAERGDGKPWSDSVPEHCRWSPTIRRRPQ